MMDSSTSSAPGRRKLPLILVLFAGSGCAALIYEIVWLQLLQLVIGSTAVSMAVLLGTYMGGLCLGSIFLPRLVSARRNPLRVYALLELGVGAIGVAVLFVLPKIVPLYSANAGHGLPGLLVRGAVAAVCLLPPTVLMGATLPALARWVETTPRGVSWLGFLYGGNTAGAVCGCLLAGFYLLRVHDMATATFVAAAINGTVAVLAFALSAVTRRASAKAEGGGTETDFGPTAIPAVASAAWPIYIAIGLSGLSALAAEVVWTRLLSLMMGATVYTFSIILAVFLTGLALGSAAGSALSRRLKNPRLALAATQLLLAAAIAWAAYLIARSLPFWPINPALTPGPWIGFQLDLVRSFLPILPAAILWGASFPLALAGLARPGQDGGRLVGRVYAANTVGAIVGAIGFSLVVIPRLGTRQAGRLMIAAAILAALATIVPELRSRGRGMVEASLLIPPKRGLGARTAAIFAAGTVAALILLLVLPVIPWQLIAYGRYLPTRSLDQYKILFAGEGMNSSVAVTEAKDGARYFHVSGRVEASSGAEDMRVQRMLGHVPALFHGDPKSVLVVGCGAGVTVGSFVLYPGVRRIVLCEIEPLIPKVVARFFGPQNYDFQKDPRVEIVYDDARHFILTTKEKFDIITSDPIHPWIKGSATLYTREYIELCKNRLNPGGIVAQWVPFYESTVATVKSEFATFFGVFANGTVWSNDLSGLGYDVVLIGWNGPAKIDLDTLQTRLDSEGYKRVSTSIHDVGFRSASDLLATYGGRASDMEPWLRGAEINRDRNLRLQYLAGIGLNSKDSSRTFDEMIFYLRFPDDLISGSPDRIRELKKAFGLDKK
jgi:spermidine synthase